jgi:hypothetical protein
VHHQVGAAHAPCCITPDYRPSRGRISVPRSFLPCDAFPRGPPQDLLEPGWAVTCPYRQIASSGYTAGRWRPSPTTTAATPPGRYPYGCYGCGSGRARRSRAAIVVWPARRASPPSPARDAHPPTSGRRRARSQGEASRKAACARHNVRHFRKCGHEAIRAEICDTASRR